MSRSCHAADHGYLEQYREAYGRAVALLAAARSVMVDLDHYVSSHGPGPDTRRDALLTAIRAMEKPIR